MIKIYPYLGTDKLKFGETRGNVRRKYKTHQEFTKNIFSQNTADSFDNLYVYYDENDQCEAIEIFGKEKVEWKDTNILGNMYSRVKALFEDEDNKLEYDKNGFISKKYGISVYVSNTDDEDAIVESVFLFKKGYYE